MAGKRARRTLSDLDDPSLFTAVDCLGGVTQLALLTVLEVLNTPDLSDFCLFDLYIRPEEVRHPERSGVNESVGDNREIFPFTEGICRSAKRHIVGRFSYPHNHKGAVLLWAPNQPMPSVWRKFIAPQ